MTFGRVPDRHRRPLGRGAPTHGDREFLPYREDHTDPHSRWLVVAVLNRHAGHSCGSIGVERIALPKPFGAALCGSSTAGAHTPSARTVSHTWRAPARALAAVRGLRLYPYTGSSSKPGFCSGNRRWRRSVTGPDDWVILVCPPGAKKEGAVIGAPRPRGAVACRFRPRAVINLN